MRQVHDVATVRAAEARLAGRLPPGTLMQRAAAGLARRCVGLLGSVYGARVVVLVGPGDNGGDALYAGARLAARGARVDALQLAERLHEPACAALRASGGRLQRVGAADGAALVGAADLILDGIVGSGGRGELRAPAARFAELAAAADGLTVAVDVPSGVDPDTGAVAGAAVRADVTVSFGTLKAGLVVSPGAGYAGIVECVDIGLDAELPTARMGLLDGVDVGRHLPHPPAEADKYSRGVLGVAAGSDAYPGAAVLAVGGALRAGAGMVRYVGPTRAAEQVRAHWPEAVVTVIEPGDAAALLAAGRVQAWVVGPGIGTDDRSERIVGALLDQPLPVLVDADALTVLARRPEWLRRRSAPTLLTPHAGEFARLTGATPAAVVAARLEWTRRAARTLGVTVLLKGTTTLVAEPDGTVRVNPTGTSWLATAGSGDVLSGICGALLAGGLSPLDAGAVGAFLHGLSGRLAAGSGGTPIIATDLLDRFPEAIGRVRATPDGSAGHAPELRGGRGVGSAP